MALASGLAPAALGATVPGALPPAFVAARALDQLAVGTPAEWCATFYIQNAQGVIVGGCGFKGAPTEGEVEIGYAVAPAFREAGAGAAAVRRLLEIAARAPQVSHVVANVAPDNVASTRLVQRLGFVAKGEWIDWSGERLVRWCWTTPPNNPSKPTPLRGAP